MNNKLPIKAILILLLSLIAGTPAMAQAVANFEWVKTVGGTNSDFAYNVATDAAGNVYKTGAFRETVDFDPGSATVNLVAAGTNPIYSDIVITKSDPSGNLIWAKSFGNQYSDAGHTVVADNYGHIYVAGTFSDTVDFNPGPGVSTLISETRSLFLLKLDTAGNYVWAKKMGTTGYNHYMSLNIDPLSGNLVVSGGFTGTADFGSISITSAGLNDIFLTKADTAGNFLWAKAIGGATAEYPSGNVSGIDFAGNIYICGYFRTTVDFDPGPGVFNLTAVGGNDGFVAKFNSSGDFVWAKQFGGTGVDAVNTVSADQTGHVYCAGTFRSAMDANPNGGVFNLTPVGGADIFITKLDTAGNFIWAKQIAGTGFKSNSGFATDNTNHIYISGSGYGDSLDIDPGAGSYKVYGGEFMLKLDSAGTFVWATNVAGYLTVDNSNNVYATGGFSLTKDFDHGPNIVNRISTGETDIFLLKLNQNCSTTSVVFDDACDSFSYNGQTYTTTGIYTQTITNGNAQGCDSIIIININISHSSDSLSTVSACGSYDFNGTVYNTSGIYIQNYTAVTGCDSLMTLDLTIFNTIYGDTITTEACDTFVLNGQGYGNSGMYIQTFPISTGCDSLIALNLTIKRADASATQSGTTLTANTANASYQWLDCNNGNTPITGAQSQSFNSNVDGSYAVIVTQDGCSDTSSCFTVEHSTGITTLSKNNHVTLFPNPNNGYFTLALSEKVTDADYCLYNAVGQMVKNRVTVNGNSVQFDISEFASGLYYLKISEPGNSIWLKVIKQ